jgi:hypothetical protein
MFIVRQSLDVAALALAESSAARPSSAPELACKRLILKEPSL